VIPRGKFSNMTKSYVLHSGDDGGYRIQRFWPNGRICEWFPRQLEDFDPDEFNERAYPGRFILAGNQLTVETVGVDEGGARFNHISATIESDGDIVYERKDSRLGLVILRFAPLDVGPMKASANW